MGSLTRKADWTKETPKADVIAWAKAHGIPDPRLYAAIVMGEMESDVVLVRDAAKRTLAKAKALLDG